MLFFIFFASFIDYCFCYQYYHHHFKSLSTSSSALSLSTSSSTLSSSTSSSFIFTTCQAGVEKILKEEIIRNHPEFKFAFSKKGLLTFKVINEDVNPSIKIKSIFSKRYGKSIGIKTYEEIIMIAKNYSEIYKQKMKLHCFSRELGGMRSEHPDFIKDRVAYVNSFKKKLLTNDDIFLKENENNDNENNDNEKNYINNDEIVFDVIVGENDEEKLFCGIHTESRNTFPGGIIPLILPAESPSRAWLKIEEAAQFVQTIYPDFSFKTGDIAIEIGSAPGGACYSLLNKGLEVYGVDPCPPDRQHAPIIKNNKKFHEIRGTLQSVTRAQLPSTCNWLLMDANISPYESLEKLILICNHYKDSLKGFFYTIKLNDDLWMKEKSLLDYIDELEGTMKKEIESCEEIVFKQLTSNRKEILCFLKFKISI